MSAGDKTVVDLGECLLPEGIEKVVLSDLCRVVDVMVWEDLAKSLSKARQLIKGNAVSIGIDEDGLGLEKVPSDFRNPLILIGYTYTFKVGKRGWKRIHLEKGKASEEP